LSTANIHRTPAADRSGPGRVVFIDIAKGISIILVVLFHSRLGAVQPGLIADLGLLRMPLFFFLAGAFFSFSKPPARLIAQKFDTLLKPYFATLCVAFLVEGLVRGEPLGGYVIKLFYGTRPGRLWGPMWFLTHLFLVAVFAYFLFHRLRLPRWSVPLKWTLLLIMLAIGSAVLGDGPRPRHPLPYRDVVLLGLPWGIDLLLVTTPFFLAGSFLKETILRWESTPPALVVLTLAVFISIASLTDAKITLYSGVYSDPLLCTAAAACGIYLVLTTARGISTVPGLGELLRFVGQSSLFILIFHRITELTLLRVLAAFTPDRPVVLLLAVFLLSLAVPIGLRSVFARVPVLAKLYFPRVPNVRLHAGTTSPALPLAASAPQKPL
jgi:fucose 4-O-acetylase-like acetyltransferase